MYFQEDDDVDDLEMFQIFSYINRSERIFKDRTNPFDLYDENTFRQKNRLSKGLVVNLTSLLKDELESITNRNNPLPPLYQILLALRFYATGTFQSVIGDVMHVSQPTVCKTVHRVSRALALKRKNYVTFPRSEDDVHKTISGFLKISNFPGVIGAIDCTHIPIQSPGGDNAGTFRNRKGYFSINVQSVCNANLKFIDIVARWPGSVHDSTIFSNCLKNAEFESGKINGILLGDNGYPNKPYLMTPILNPQDKPEKKYNRSQIKTRNTVERQFGIWKRRFPCLKLGLRVKLENIPPIIVACAVLHNIAIDASENHELLEDENSIYQEVPATHDYSNSVASAVRQTFINQYFS